MCISSSRLILQAPYPEQRIVTGSSGRHRSFARATMPRWPRLGSTGQCDVALLPQDEDGDEGGPQQWCVRFDVDPDMLRELLRETSGSGPKESIYVSNGNDMAIPMNRMDEMSKEPVRSTGGPFQVECLTNSGQNSSRDFSRPKHGHGLYGQMKEVFDVPGKDLNRRKQMTCRLCKVFKNDPPGPARKRRPQGPDLLPPYSRKSSQLPACL